MNLYRKYYTANTIDHEGNLVGSRVRWVPFWESASSVYLKMIKDTPNGRLLVDFRRVE